ncbi:protein of unknown function [Nonomuraea solani]|uniref:DUF4158 domain-containing protein n=1 Tax=Nonomuraea solani TaxID=1144553 RepID=A0A1H6ESS1_9ACTN|nr:protein of unknown function [Nonomuraea solani]
MVDYLAEQLGISDPSQVKKKAVRAQTAYDHAWMIRDTYGYHDFDDRASWEGRVLSKRFLTFLNGRAWTHAEGPTALFDQSVAWLRRHRVLLPGVTVLERLRQAPKRQSGTEMAKALQRVDDIARFELVRVRVDKVPVRRMKTLAKYGAGTKAPPLLARLAEPRQTAHGAGGDPVAGGRGDRRRPRPVHAADGHPVDLAGAAQVDGRAAGDVAEAGEGFQAAVAGGRAGSWWRSWTWSPRWVPIWTWPRCGRRSPQKRARARSRCWPRWNRSKSSCRKTTVEKLGALGESPSLKWLPAACQAMLPRIDQPELLLEVHS